MVKVVRISLLLFSTLVFKIFTDPGLHKIRHSSLACRCGFAFSSSFYIKNGSLSSKRFRRFFRTLEAFFEFWPHKNWSERKKCVPSPSLPLFALAPIFARPKSEKCLERAGRPTEMLVTQVITEKVSLVQRSMLRLYKASSQGYPGWKWG